MGKLYAGDIARSHERFCWRAAYDDEAASGEGDDECFCSDKKDYLGRIKILGSGGYEHCLGWQSRGVMVDVSIY